MQQVQPDAQQVQAAAGGDVVPHQQVQQAHVHVPARAPVEENKEIPQAVQAAQANPNAGGLNVSALRNMLVDNQGHVPNV